MLRGHLTHRLDRDLARYVLRDERVVVAVRKHWTAHAKPFGLSVLALIVAVWTDIKAPPTPAGAAASQAFWALWLISLLWVAWTVLNWRRDWFVATDKRFLMFYGFITRKVAMMPLAKVTDLTFNRSIMGRLLGYGDFTLESAGQHQALGQIDYIPDADEHYREICAVLFGEDEDDDGNPFRDGGFDDGTDDYGEDDTGGGDPAYPSPASPDRGGEGRDHGDHREAYAVSEARAFGMPVRPSSRPGRHRPRDLDDSWEGGSATRPRVEYLYRSRESDDAAERTRRADTDEIPVVRALPLPPRSTQPPNRRQKPRVRAREDRTEELLYPPKEWLD
ncbi:MAG TPA: PH domain-containing protein [Phycicoccus sp.]|nr:PH domain-containing protein [Phycicoccus sp.]